jgi:hypothetical protein
MESQEFGPWVQNSGFKWWPNPDGGSRVPLLFKVSCIPPTVGDGT